jgi:hypothetical protein
MTCSASRHFSSIVLAVLLVSGHFDAQSHEAGLIVALNEETFEPGQTLT